MLANTRSDCIPSVSAGRNGPSRQAFLPGRGNGRICTTGSRSSRHVRSRFRNRQFNPKSTCLVWFLCANTISSPGTRAQSKSRLHAQLHSIANTNQPMLAFRNNHKVVDTSELHSNVKISILPSAPMILIRCAFHDTSLLPLLIQKREFRPFNLSPYHVQLRINRSGAVSILQLVACCGRACCCRRQPPTASRH